jgi:hypothetical protein
MLRSRVSVCHLLHLSRKSLTVSPLAAERAFKNSFMSDVDSKIKQYEDKFKDLKMAFQDRAILQTGITVSRIMDNLESLGELLQLVCNSAFMLTVFVFQL